MAALVKILPFRLALNQASAVTNVGINLLLKRNYKARWVEPTLRDLKRRKDIETERTTLRGGETIFHRSTFLEW